MDKDTLATGINNWYGFSMSIKRPKTEKRNKIQEANEKGVKMLSKEKLNNAKR
jgi:hypothetical protein